MSGRGERREKRRKRRISTSSESSSSSSSSSSSEVQMTKYIADLEAFLHSVGMTGTSNDLSFDPNPKKEKRTKKEKKPKEDKGHTPRSPTPQKPKSGIPLPMSNVHLQSGGKGMLESPDPPSVAK